MNTTKPARICDTCDKPLAYHADAWMRGENTWQHADGSTGHWVNPKPQCPKCGSFDFATTQEAYGNASDCHSCGYHDYSSIGD